MPSLKKFEGKFSLTEIQQNIQEVIQYSKELISSGQNLLSSTMMKPNTSNTQIESICLQLQETISDLEKLLHSLSSDKSASSDMTVLKQTLVNKYYDVAKLTRDYYEFLEPISINKSDVKPINIF